MADPARSSMKDGRQKPDWDAGVPLLLEVHFDPHLCVPPLSVVASSASRGSRGPALKKGGGLEQTRNRSWAVGRLRRLSAALSGI